MTLHAKIQISFDNDRENRGISESLPKRNVGRSSIDVVSKDKTLVMEFSAPDIGALRASINSQMRLVKVAADSAKVIKSR